VALRRATGLLAMFNPNPDRASRSATAALPAPEENDTAVIAVAAPAAVTPEPVVVVTGEIAAAAATPSESEEHEQLQPVRAVGLSKPMASIPIRATPSREGSVWKCVNIIAGGNTATPQVTCKGCGKMFLGGATRIQNHLLGEQSSKKCSTEHADADFLRTLDAIRKNAVNKCAAKKRKLAVASVNSIVRSGAAMTIPSSAEQREGNQSTLTFYKATADSVDEAIARFFYACNISAHVAEHQMFKEMVQAAKAAAPGYQPPTRQRLYGSLLDTVYEKTKRQLFPLQESVMRECGTVCSDGWDSITRDHLINFLFGNASAMFFEGTYELCANDAEDADMIADLVSQCMRKLGPLSIIQFVSDTCSVMKVSVLLSCVCMYVHA
jgi:hypothetical protein